MPDAPAGLDADHEDMARAFLALGSATRLDILAALRFPRAPADVVVRPRRHRPGENPERPISSPAVRQHLEKLLELELVKAAPEPAGAAKGSPRYVVNRPRVYALAEGFQQLAALYGGHILAGDGTVTLGAGGEGEQVRGPRLVLVHGAYEGRAFALRDEFAKDGRWTIGRREGLPITLDYDPYVSREHAYLLRHEGGFAVMDADGSHNGTAVNWRMIAKGLPRKLRPGDVLGVGRSRLVFVDG